LCKKAIEFGIPEEDAFCMATKTPARLMNVNKGQIKPGFDADLIILDDCGEICMTVLNGIIK